jgi:hypothetical protein
MDCVECESPDMVFTMLADLYYPIITQGNYGEIKKEWVLDRTIVCNAAPVGGASSTDREDIKPDLFLQYENKLIARTKKDPRVSSRNSQEAVTNILITNIRSSNSGIIYRETAGPRSGKGTIYEIATLEPFWGPFREIEYYKMVWRRTENQAVGD